VPLQQDGANFAHTKNFAMVWIPMCPITEACGGINILKLTETGDYKKEFSRVLGFHQQIYTIGNKNTLVCRLTS